jgi:uncharacterized protein (TIGR02646 family)
MIYIEKGAEPTCFSEWKALEFAPDNEGWKPTFDKLQNPEKLEVKRALMREQHGICCYCERPITEDDCHLEHLAPQSVTGTTQSVEYGNLLCSCIKEQKPGIPLHCGHLRGNWNAPEFIKPLEMDCSEHFAYGLDGTIRACDPTDERAKLTIERLGLSIDILNKKRKAILDSIFLDEPELTIDEQRQFAAKLANPNINGSYTLGFPSMLRYLFLIN